MTPRIAIEDARPDAQRTANSRRWTRALTLSLCPLLFYYLVVFIPGVGVGRFIIRVRQVPLLFLVVVITIYLLVSIAHKRNWLSANQLKGLTAAGISLTLCTFITDVASAIYFSSDKTSADFEEARQNDPQIWHGEMMPRSYFPTTKEFSIFKPNFTVTANVYGPRYYPELMKSTVLKSIFEKRRLTVSIDENGFRDSTSLPDARIFALGDSFTFGSGTTQEKIWPVVLAKTLGQNVYNLGIPSKSPKQELMLLEYVYQTKPETLKVDHLIWMIFEGNDLEESYEELQARYRPIQLWGGILQQVRENSVLHRLITTGRLAYEADESYLVEGMKVPFPVYYSDKFGYRLSNANYRERAAMTQAELNSHPHTPLLAQTFKEMSQLSRDKGFAVTVVIAPTDVSLYSPYFKNMNPASEEPSLISYVDKISREQGFDVVNLWRDLQPYAKNEMLYWRDDVHWNDRGNEVVAAILTEHFKNKKKQETLATK
jgi:hypothetical protein